ncbi:class I SAM-dependent methyltransferase [Streptomyces chromofuscus]|uniref:Class I SAM-dependent methyltransferase n=2 Tax=Streptomyces chromofuscus TaxID=42881 RepID=A0A7M2TIG4_STRCW|nr:class I SAM-dependent methyltransferase [Streptomyces chromofuscus]QOV47725.1 class I SAM-dependent methyltransferase [Streptomyces chromofuscus]
MTFLEATRTSYDAIAADYASRFPDAMGGVALDRAVVGAFAELARTHSPAPVADLGSGPGHVTALLHDLGLPVFGVDLSPRMVALARRAHPGLRFHEGSMTGLDLPDATLGGIAALYSVIHVPDEHLPATFAEFHRVLRPGAPVLLSFQTTEAEDHLHISERFGHEIALDYYWRTPEQVEQLLIEAGLAPYARVRREADGGEKYARAFLLARRPR